MEIQTYDNIQIRVIQATSMPGTLVRLALDLTMKKYKPEGVLTDVSEKTLAFIMDADHTSVLEHIHFTFLIIGASRSFLAQITRHRVGSFTSASQHYQDYREYPMVIHPDLYHNITMRTALEISLDFYKSMIDKEGIEPQEARQCLPNAAAINLLWSVNARSLLNFFRQRLCHRNVDEMQIVARKIWTAVYHIWPEYAKLVGPPCYMDGSCNQGKMSCGRRFEHEI